MSEEKKSAIRDLLEVHVNGSKLDGREVASVVAPNDVGPQRFWKIYLKNGCVFHVTGNVTILYGDKPSKKV